MCVCVRARAGACVKQSEYTSDSEKDLFCILTKINVETTKAQLQNHALNIYNKSNIIFTKSQYDIRNGKFLFFLQKT